MLMTDIEEVRTLKKDLRTEIIKWVNIQYWDKDTDKEVYTETLQYWEVGASR